LSVVKTAFHTGALEVVWQMGFASSVPATSAQDALSQRFIWDVTQSSSIEFEVPYVARTPWTQIYFASFGQLVAATDMSTGRIFVNVINPLTNSSGSVPSSVTILAYISGGHDIEFGLPGRSSQIFASPAPIGEEELEMLVGEKHSHVEAFVPQGGPFGEEETVEGLSGMVIKELRPVPKTSMWAHLSTLGERVLSLRLLIKRFGSMRTPIPITMSLADVRLNNYFIGYLDLGFFFYTGSYRVNIVMSKRDYVVVFPPPTWSVAWNGLAVYQEDGCARMTIQDWSQATVLEVPYYGVTAFKYVGDNGSTKLQGPTYPNSAVQYAAGDDFGYGFQCGAGQFVYNNALPPPLY